MSRKKNLLDYLALTLFIMCMGLALSASLEYVTRATEREYLGQGIWVLSMAGLSLLALLLGRISRKCGQKMQPLPKNIVMIVFGAVLVGVGVYLRLWVIWNIPVEPDSDFETYYRMANHLLNDTLMSAEGAVDRRYIALYPHTIGFPMLILWPTFAIFGASVRKPCVQCDFHPLGGAYRSANRGAHGRAGGGGADEPVAVAHPVQQHGCHRTVLHDADSACCGHDDEYS